MCSKLEPKRQLGARRPLWTLPPNPINTHRKEAHVDWSGQGETHGFMWQQEYSLQARPLVIVLKKNSISLLRSLSTVPSYPPGWCLSHSPSSLSQLVVVSFCPPCCTLAICFLTYSHPRCPSHCLALLSLLWPQASSKTC